MEKGLHSHGRGPSPGVLRPAGVGGVAVGGDVIGLAGGSGVGHIGDVGTAVFGDERGIFVPLEGEYILIGAVGLLFVYDDLAGPQFPHGPGGYHIEFDSQGSAAGFCGGDTGMGEVIAGPGAGRECRAEYQGQTEKKGEGFGSNAFHSTAAPPMHKLSRSFARVGPPSGSPGCCTQRFHFSKLQRCVPCSP